MSTLKTGDDWKDLINVDLPRIGPITEQTRETTMQESVRFRGSVRLSEGRFETDQEYEEHRNRVLNIPLP